VKYEVWLDRQPERYLRRLDRRTQERIHRRLQQIADDPYSPRTRQLVDAERLRAARVGGWRILFFVNEEAHAIQIVDISPRGQIYRGL
jgi:mRNA-degrading endonuclease RelE of RelBE toxin-antitoxin system